MPLAGISVDGRSAVKASSDVDEPAAGGVNCERACVDSGMGYTLSVSARLRQ